MEGSAGTQRRPLIAIAAAVVQLGFAGAGALELDFDRWGGAVSQYAALSGTDSAYGFFAPGVGTQLRALFDVLDARGTTSTDVLTAGLSREADIRVSDMVAIFWMDDQDLQRAVAASWAGKIFARHPEAAVVVVHLDAYELPTMAEYHQGQRPSWSPYYEARFIRTRKPQGPSEPAGGGGRD